MSKIDYKKVRKVFQSEMKRIAKDLGKDPDEVTRTEFLNLCTDDYITYERIKVIGGYLGLKGLYFPPKVNPVAAQANQMIKRHKDRLNREIGTEVFLTEEMTNVIKSALKKHPPRIYKPKKQSMSRKKKKRTLVAHFSDLHYGCVVKPEEMGGTNKWDWKVASRRTALFVQQITDYKPHYRNDTDLVVCLNGDIIAGLIHNQEWFAEPLTTQFAGTVSILGQALSYLASQFNRVQVKCTPGNHGRSVHKQEKGRASTHKWDSYETIIYVALREALLSLKNISFDIPETPYVIFEAQGHVFMQTHGDTFINVGNPGSNLNTKSINEQINKLNASDLTSDKHVDVVLVGHVHTPTMLLTDSGCTLFINGCLIGTDPFAQSIGIHDSHPAQWLFEVTDSHAVGDQRLIKVAGADDKGELDKIIKPFEGRYYKNLTRCSK